MANMTKSATRTRKGRQNGKLVNRKEAVNEENDINEFYNDLEAERIRSHSRFSQLDIDEAIEIFKRNGGDLS